MDRRNEIDVCFQLVQADDHVRRKLLPFRVEILASVAEETTGEAVARRFSFFALIALDVGRVACLAEGVSDIELMVHEEGFLQARDSALRERGGLAAVGALDDLTLRTLAR